MQLLSDCYKEEITMSIPSQDLNEQNVCLLRVLRCLPIQSVPINTEVISRNPAQARCTLCDNAWQLLATEILLKVALNIINETKIYLLRVLHYFLYLGI